MTDCRFNDLQRRVWKYFSLFPAAVTIAFNDIIVSSNYCSAWLLRCWSFLIVVLDEVSMTCFKDSIQSLSLIVKQQRFISIYNVGMVIDVITLF